MENQEKATPLKKNWSKDQSGQVEAAQYNPSTKVLSVKFRRTETIYNYADVPEKKWAGLLNAESAGKYMNAFIKPDHKFTIAGQEG